MRSVTCVLAAAAVALVCVESFGAAPATVTLDSASRHQTFRGWEVVVQATVRDFFQTLPAYDEALRQAASDLGITRVKVSLFSGTEGPRGFAGRYVSGELPEGDFLKNHAYHIVNDNRDPDVANLEGFDFTLLDWQMSHIVAPYMRHLAAAGQQGEVLIQYGDFGVSNFEHHGRPREYAEFLHVTFDYLKSKYGLVPTAVDVVNEPDTNTQWSGADIGRAAVAAGRRLAAAGYRPVFMAPSVMDRGRALPMLADILREKESDRFIRMITFHCYADSGKNTLAMIGEVQARAGVETGQNECWSELNDPKALMADLKLANVSAWQQATFHGPNGLYLLDPEKRTATLRPKTRLLRQFYKYIRPGAVRIEATSSDAAMDPVAFVDDDGRPVVVVRAAAAGTVDVEPLPPGVYDVSYTTAQRFDVHEPEYHLPNGGRLTASIPDAGVMTIRAVRTE